MKPEFSPVRGWFRRVAAMGLGVALIFSGRAVWRAYDLRAAVHKAQTAGWTWESRDPVSLILANWRTARWKETWTLRYRKVALLPRTELASAGALLDRLQPTEMIARECPNSDIDVLNKLLALQSLDLTGCIKLQNVDGLKGIAGLRSLVLAGCTGLQNVDGLKGITGLRSLDLSECTGLRGLDALRNLHKVSGLDLTGCTGLQNLDVLNGLPELEELRLIGCIGLRNLDTLQNLPALRRLNLNGCIGLQNVDGLKGHPALQRLDLSLCTGLQNVEGLNTIPSFRIVDLRGCIGLSAEAVRALRLTLPKEAILYSDEDGGGHREP